MNFNFRGEEMLEERVYSVTEFNKMVKVYLEENSLFQEFFLEGELSGVTYYKSGHLYFNLKDKNAQIKCVAFKYKFKRIDENLKDGDLVKLFGDVGFYENRGDFQILVRHIEKKERLGELFAELEKLKLSMQEEGYFSIEHKQKLPKYPKVIGVVTALTGAAVQDIIKTVKKRDNSVKIYIYPAKVQGVGAKEEIIKGIETLNKIEEIDLIIAGRGGGSIEDLWAFNEKETAFAFFNSKKPIISAVGHEIDNLLTDLVADVRAATPTQAVEISIPEKREQIEILYERGKYLKTLILKILEGKKNELKGRKNNHYIKNYRDSILTQTQLLIEREKKLKKGLEIFLNLKGNELNSKIQKLMGLNPLKTLERGYSVVSNNGKIVKQLEDVNLNDELIVRVTDGKIKTNVKEKITKKGVNE